MRMSDIEEMLTSIRREILKLDISPFKLFKTIATGHSLFIDKANLAAFLRKLNIVLDLSELSPITLLRFTKGKELKVSFIDFLQAVLPFETERFVGPTITRSASKYSPSVN
eukprot:TRINITY_DN6547_c0_g1_i19.p2 TRINITY_DN6547_c0_g1~~TRINITY_DN6547_c0_g1_i19.p2  ORF type:complete len:111 (-),score=27.14 TRINITY_DN6547_c0_g1_i19:121-453(-)